MYDRKITYGPRYAQFSSFFKKKGAMLDGTKTLKRRQKHRSCSAFMGSWVWFRDNEELATPVRDVECTTLKPRELLSICRSDLCMRWTIIGFDTDVMTINIPLCNDLWTKVLSRFLPSADSDMSQE